MKREILQSTAVIANEPLSNGALEGTRNLLEAVIGRLEHKVERSSKKQFKIESVDYKLPFSDLKRKCPQQVVTVVAIASPGSNLSLGLLNPSQAQILFGKRSPDKEWGANTYVVPMGKIEPEDISPGNGSIGDTILQASRREFKEEVESSPSGGWEIIAGSFLDIKTNTMVHIVLKQVSETDGGEMSVSTPDMREHTNVKWIKLDEIHTTEPMETGTAVVICEGLKYLLKSNQATKQSDRYKDNI